MGLFKKFKDILFEEEEYTEQIKITPEMRNEETPSKEEAPKKVASVKIPEKPVNRQEEYQERPVREEKPVPREVQRDSHSNNISERELFKSDATFPFLDFDEDEFEHQNPVSRAQTKAPVEPTIPKRPSNVFEYEKKRKVEKRTDYGRFEKVETTETVERKKFKPSPIISPVYGILNQDYVKEEVQQKASVLSSKTPDLNTVRQKAFGEINNNKVEEVPDKRTYYEEKTVTITKPEEKKKKVRTIDELLEETSDVEIDTYSDKHEEDYDESPRLNKREDISIDDTKEMEISSSDDDEDTLENDLFDLIDSMYDNKEDGD